jgi:CubicO group peptidase (beta-lactamase class C family)
MMISTRRSLLKMGLVGLLVPQGRLASADEKGRSFEAWRHDFEASIPARMGAARISGAAVAIASRDNATRYTAAFGFADLAQNRKLTADTPVHLASVSKLVTATALVQLFERKGYDLREDINKFIDFRIKNPRHPKLPITPHQLITHTSSISDEGYDDLHVSTEGDPTQSLKSFLKSYLVEGGAYYSSTTSFFPEKPGKRWSYCNVGVALAGYAVQCISKQSFSSYTQKNIFEPLGIRNAHWYLKEFASDVLAKPYEFVKGSFHELPQEGYPDVPSGMLRCSVADLTKILRAMLGGETGQRAILSPRAVAAMLRDQVNPDLVSYQGLGWVSEPINGHDFVGHSGSDVGASNMVVLTPDQTHAVAVLMNIEGTKKTDKFRASVIEDLVVGAKLARW